MATTFSSVYDKFLKLIESVTLAKLTDQQMTEFMDSLLDASIELYFTNCKTDLSDRNSTQFNQTLSSREEWILAHGMVLVWYESNVNSERKLKNNISTKDYTIYSPANLLDKLVALNKYSEKKFRQLMVMYSFSGDFNGFN